MLKKYEILINSISSQKKYCEGIWGGKLSNYYSSGMQLAAVKSLEKFSHKGSDNLDKIFCFDLAETANANFSQINMISVSSFCGVNGLIWGYDICPIEKKLLGFSIKNKNIKIYDINPLCGALKKLLGTVDKPRFPFLAGSHVPCASKNIIVKGENFIYAAEGIGIPVNRNKDACLLMEDVGHIPLNIKYVDEYKAVILKKLVKSILHVGYNQKVNFKEIFIGIKSIKVDNGEYGCAIVISPYFSIAEDAVPKYNDIFLLDINAWENIVRNNFLYNYGNI
ncbi:MAG: histidine decarboxylase, pyruvoyl type [Patescibacteria group bacterium]|nr:histidine decarboxylase, pyruvoyl type [Patescibacteria group bacterium]